MENFKIVLIIFNFLIICSVLLFADDNDIHSYVGSYSEKHKHRKIQGAELFLNRLLFCLIAFYFIYSFYLNVISD